MTDPPTLGLLIWAAVYILPVVFYGQLIALFERVEGAVWRFIIRKIGGSQ